MRKTFYEVLKISLFLLVFLSLNRSRLNSLKAFYPIFKFVAIFGGIYFILSLGYYYYLQIDYSAYNFPDPVTAQVSYQTQEMLKWLGYDAVTLNSDNDPSVLMFVDGQSLYRVVEGCNAMSIMILFTAFLLAFYRGFKHTFLFFLKGVLFLYVVNALRLVILALVEVHWQEYAEVTHDVIFPASIYTAVILLWILWLTQKSKDEVVA